MKGPGYPAGVPTPYAMHIHPYPTRFHGGIWTRPVFGFPSAQAPSTVFIPGRDIDMRPDKPYTGPGVAGIHGLGGDGTSFDVGEGVFRPGGYGGGVFDGNLAGAPALGKRGRSTLGASPGAPTATASDKVNYPYGKYSAQTLQLQNALNAYIVKLGYCPLIADGKLGAATCGAAVFRPAVDGQTVPTTCEDFKEVQKASDGCGTGPKPPAVTPVQSGAGPNAAAMTLPMSSSTKKVLGFIAGGLGAVAIVYYVKKRR